MKLANLNSHERDKNIVFDEEPHVYYIKEKAYSLSVTSFIHEFFEKFDSKGIIEKFYDRWQDNESSKYYGMSPEEILDSWEENRVKQAQLGTDLHNAIELFYNDKKYTNNSKEFSYFLDFNDEHSHLKAHRTEWNIYCEELEIAGSVDMVYEDNGVFHIYDWKRSKEIKEQNRYQEGKYPLSHLPDTNFWHYALQLNVYKAILEKYYGKKIDDLCLVVLHPNNSSYIKIKVPELKEEVEAMFKIREESLKNKIIV
jgi:ATP-dependent exoDNAse (exonuclease V) beta subunit